VGPQLFGREEVLPRYPLEWFKKKKTPCWRHGMAQMAIRVSGQRQKHGPLLLGEIAKWLLRFSGDHHLTTPDTSLRTPPLLRQTSADVAATVATAAAVDVIAAISAIVPSAVVAAVVLVLLPLPPLPPPPPPPPSLPLPLLVDCCLLFVSTAVAVAAAAAAVAVDAPTAVVVVATHAAVTVAVVIAAITVAATGNAVGGGGGAELMG
jgi:hypothetical protein